MSSTEKIQDQPKGITVSSLMEGKESISRGRLYKNLQNCIPETTRPIAEPEFLDHHARHLEWAQVAGVVMIAVGVAAVLEGAFFYFTLSASVGSVFFLGSLVALAGTKLALVATDKKDRYLDEKIKPEEAEKILDKFQRNVTYNRELREKLYHIRDLKALEERLVGQELQGFSKS